MTSEDELFAYLEHVDRELVSKMQDCGVVVSLVPRGPTDLKFALELGVAIMLDKPIIALVSPGMPVPEHLVRVADRIVEWHGGGDIAAVIKQALDELGKS